MKKYIANIITSGRIVLSLLLLCIPLSSAWCYVIYLFAGFTDMVDGTIARKTDTVSEFGSSLDTVADFVFLAVSLSKFLPILELPAWLWLWIAIIALMKITSIIIGVMIQHRFIAFHSVLNKITGVCLFVLPVSPCVIEVIYSGSVICAIATVAALQELLTVTTKDRENN